MIRLTASIITACLGCTSPRTISKRLIAHGYSGSSEEVEAFFAIREIQNARASVRPGADPLLLASWSRPRRAAERRREKAVSAAAMYPFWREDFRSRTLSAARCNFGEDGEAQLATLEAICREARRRGWQVRHTSQAKNGRVSSRYIVVPGHGEARVSDHELPWTPERQDRRDSGRRTSWNGEVVIGSQWWSVRLETWMRRVALAAAGRL